MRLPGARSTQWPVYPRVFERSLVLKKIVKPLIASFALLGLVGVAAPAVAGAAPAPKSSHSKTAWQNWCVHQPSCAATHHRLKHRLWLEYCRTHSSCYSQNQWVRRNAVQRSTKGYWIRVMTTAYCPCNNAMEGGPVAYDGTMVSYGTVAAYLPQFPLLTRMWIPGYGNGTVHDTGGAIGWGHIDLAFATEGQAFTWGVRYKSIKVFSR
jgi:3D (Asp-Asp-Asp) domain-containing protein